MKYKYKENIYIYCIKNIFFINLYDIKDNILYKKGNNYKLLSIRKDNFKYIDRDGNISYKTEIQYKIDSKKDKKCGLPNTQSFDNIEEYFIPLNKHRKEKLKKINNYMNKINKKYDCYLQVWQGSDCILNVVEKFNNIKDAKKYILSKCNIKNSLEYTIIQYKEEEIITDIKGGIS
jgi:hypothetical protein